MKWTSILTYLVYVFIRYVLVMFYGPGAILGARVMSENFEADLGFYVAYIPLGLERKAEKT